MAVVLYSFFFLVILGIQIECNMGSIVRLDIVLCSALTVDYNTIQN